MSWRNKHPCTTCGTGYGYCVEGWRFNLMCCGLCDHPSRWVKKPYTNEEIKEMWDEHESGTPH